MVVIKVKEKDNLKVFEILTKIGGGFTSFKGDEYAISSNALDSIIEAGIKFKQLTPRELMYPVKCYSCKASDFKKKLFPFRYKGRTRYTCVNCYHKGLDLDK